MGKEIFQTLVRNIKIFFAGRGRLRTCLPAGRRALCHITLKGRQLLVELSFFKTLI